MSALTLACDAKRIDRGEGYPSHLANQSERPRGDMSAKHFPLSGGLSRVLTTPENRPVSRHEKPFSLISE